MKEAVLLYEARRFKGRFVRLNDKILCLRQPRFVPADYMTKIEVSQIFVKCVSISAWRDNL